VLDVIDNQVGALRKRVLIASYENKVRTGTYWGIGTDIANYNLATALKCDHTFTLKLAATPTRLTAMDVGLQHQLIDWGYAVCDAAMRSYVVPQAPAPTQSPFGTFKTFAAEVPPLQGSTRP
jgi:NTE family protein